MPRPGSCEQSRPRGSSSVHGALASPSGLKEVNEATQQSQKFLWEAWQVTQASSPTSSACERPEDPGQLLPDPGRQEHDGGRPGPTPQFLNFQRAPL